MSLLSVFISALLNFFFLIARWFPFLDSGKNTILELKLLYWQKMYFNHGSWIAFEDLT